MFANETPNVKLLLHFCVCNFAVGIHFAIISIYAIKSFQSLSCIFHWGRRCHILLHTFQYCSICPMAIRRCYNVLKTFRIEIENFMCRKSEANIFLWIERVYRWAITYMLCAWKHFTINWKVYWIIFTIWKVETVCHTVHGPFMHGRVRIQWSTWLTFTWLTTLNVKKTQIHRSQIHVRTEQQHFGQIDMPIYYYTLQQAFILELIDEILCSINGRKCCG